MSSSKILSINVVKRPFRSNGVFYAAGSIIKEPAVVRLFRSKVAEGKIVIVDEHNIDKISDYLLYKQGVDVKELLKGALLRGVSNDAPIKVLGAPVVNLQQGEKETIVLTDTEDKDAK